VRPFTSASADSIAAVVTVLVEEAAEDLPLLESADWATWVLRARCACVVSPRARPLAGSTVTPTLEVANRHPLGEVRCGSALDFLSRLVPRL